MGKNNKIPLLGKHNYAGHYFKEASDKRKQSVPDQSFHQFEISHRCIWKSHIAPHRLDFYLVFLVTEGEGIHSFGLQEHYIRKNMLCFVGPHMINEWKSEVNEHKGYFCTFSDEFFNVGRADRQFLRTLPFFQLEGNGVLHLNRQQAAYYSTLFGMMKQEFDARNAYSDNILRSQLSVLLNKAHSELQTAGCPVNLPNDPRLGLVKKFTNLFSRDLNLLSEGGTVQLKRVGDYAKEIGVSQNHLNDTIKAVTGKSAGQMMKGQLIKHATLCLKYSTKSISEIAYTLGFEDPSYFSRYYKIQTGKSPSEYR